MDKELYNKLGFRELKSDIIDKIPFEFDSHGSFRYMNTITGTRETRLKKYKNLILARYDHICDYIISTIIKNEIYIDSIQLTAKPVFSFNNYFIELTLTDGNKIFYFHNKKDRKDKKGYFKVKNIKVNFKKGDKVLIKREKLNLLDLNNVVYTVVTSYKGFSKIVDRNRKEIKVLDTWINLI